MAALGNKNDPKREHISCHVCKQTLAARNEMMIKPEVVIALDQRGFPAFDGQIINVWVRVDNEWHVAKWRYLEDDEVQPGVMGEEA